eukprot:scaffold667_cov262-Pinguiococcus_pyrenoidosus.AAC.8
MSDVCVDFEIVLLARRVPYATAVCHGWLVPWRRAVSSRGTAGYAKMMWLCGDARARASRPSIILLPDQINP